MNSSSPSSPSSPSWPSWPSWPSSFSFSSPSTPGPILAKGFKYHQSLTTSKKTYLKCSQAKCKGTAHISRSIDGSESFEEKRPHTCEHSIMRRFNLRRTSEYIQIMIDEKLSDYITRWDLTQGDIYRLVIKDIQVWN